MPPLRLVTGERVKRRLIGLIVALLLAGIATFAIYQLVTTADERAREQEALAQVFVAQGDILAGTPADQAIAQGLIARDEIPARTVPEGAIGSLDAIDGLVATVQIFDGEIIVAQRFGSTVADTTGTFEIPEGLQAVTVEADVVRGVAGFVQAQDTVSVLATLDAPVDDAPPPTDDEDEDVTTAGGSLATRTQYLVQNVTVLAVGQRVVSTEEEQDGTTIQQSNERYLFTLAMTPEDIEQLVFAFQEGTIQFTLLPPLADDEEERESVETPGRTIENAFS
jgi:pilus assembly protein CpaB